MKRFFFLAALGLSLSAVAAPVSFTQDINKVLSKLQSMGRDSYTTAEWNEVYRMLADIEARAKAGEAWDALIEARVVHAMVIGDMQRNPQSAIDLLQRTKRELRDRHVPEMKKVYVRLAELHAKVGDEGAVNRTIQEFQASPYYDPQDYPFSGGQGPASPLVIIRPNAAGSSSISETAMKVHQAQSRFTNGAAFPDFELTDVQGVKINAKSMAGRVTLFDFWNKDWSAWKNDLKNLSATYLRYRKQGFEIVGVNIDPAAGDLTAFMTANSMLWPQVSDGRDLARTLGIFGECANILVDGNGVIIGRNLHGADLVEAIKRALVK